MNYILTTLNQALGAKLYTLANPDGSPQTLTTLQGLPLGTSDNTSDGELALKVIVVADRASIVNGSLLVTSNLQAYKNVADADIPEAIGTGLVESVMITAQKDRDTANTGKVWIGFTSGNGTQLRRLTPGESVIYSAVNGKKLDLAGIYADVETDGDGVLIESAN